MATAVATPTMPGCLGWGPEAVAGGAVQADGTGLGAAFPQEYMLPPGGSEMHGALDEYGQPACQPCAWFYKESGCLNAAPCKYCHLCPQGELKNRKKKKIARLRSEENVVQAVGNSREDFEEPAYVRVPAMDLRRSKTAPPTLEHQAEEEDATPMGLDTGLLLPPGLDAHMQPVLDPSLGPLFSSWGVAPWALDPAATFGYDPQLGFPMAFPPAPVGPRELGPPMASPAAGLLLPPPPEEPPALLDCGGSTPLHPPPPPPEQSPHGALAHVVDSQSQVAVWGTSPDDSLAADLQMACNLLPADLQAEIQLDPPALSMSGSLWEDSIFHSGQGHGRPAEVEPPTLEASAPEPPELERTTTQTAVRTEEGEDGTFCVSWTVDARKLKASDKVAVSPAFQVPTAPGNFRMMLLPKVVDDRKGGASFKRAKGKGLVQVKCEENLEDPRGGTVALRLSVRSGGPEAESPERQEPPRGPITHDFAEKGIFGLPRGQEEWDFGKIVNGSQTFVVCLDVLPPCLLDTAVEAPLGPPPGLGRDAWGPLVARAAGGTEDDWLLA
mmetsp:Transcript_55182/g.172429  ORF Transcript_55182/g.172429 Transcript_55182/m.172429 type:complete len:554 (-) Transcript_55182:145-1806(-)